MSAPSGKPPDAPRQGQPQTGGRDRFRRQGGRPAHRGDTDRAPPADAPAGLAARQEAVRLVAAVTAHHHALDDALAQADTGPGALSSRDRAFARLLASTVLRRLGRLEAVLTRFLEKPLPSHQGTLWPILLTGAAQLLFLETPPHAAVSLAVEQARRDHHARRFDKLVNALLRRVGREGAVVLASLDGVALDVPGWMLARWESAYGAATAHAIAAAQLEEAALDLTVTYPAETAAWAERLGAGMLATGSLRLSAGGRVTELPGFAEGAWWVQDAAAALPVRLMGPVRGRSVVDLCAAPGGKSAQLAAAGARLTAVDLADARLARLADNLKRLGLEAECIAADVTTWEPGRTFEAVLLDAPCTATGTIRRHPDILRLKRESDLAAVAETQARLLAASGRLTAAGGLLVYCTCSLEPEEGRQQVERFLADNADFALAPIVAGEAGVIAEWITSEGELRTLPCHLADATPPGLDGFYAARMRRAG